MKFRCERDDLLEAVQFASRAISTRAVLPVLSGLRIEAVDPGTVRIGGTDLELAMETSFQAGIDEPGRVIVPGRLFGEMTRSLGAGQVSLASGDGEVEIGSGRGHFRVKSLASDDYPALPIEDLDAGEGIRIELDGEELATALSQVVRAASTDESRQILTGILWEIDSDTLTLAATDSYRLAVRTLRVSGGSADPIKVVLPARALGELGRALQGGAGTVTAIIKDNLIGVTLKPSTEGSGAGNSVIGSRFIEGEFPNYRQLLPEGYTNALTIDRDLLIEVVKRVGLLAQNNLPVKLQLASELEVSAHTPDVGEGQEIVDADFQGEPLLIAFNPQFLTDGAAAIRSERILLEAADGLKPAILRGEQDPAFTYLLMPVRLS
ncbi:MAG: polymerase subunit beta [Actinomycetota bacterium]|jgi:DNA polymerase-3 subunit beta|nr:polymerase subunit beta [Actinomycetota bacterium]MEA2487090.1 polymerase subunit beta [Actinomycetota bacterium]